MSFKIIQQVVILGIGIALVFLYVQPQLGTIQGTQDEIAKYSEAVSRASEFNRELNAKLNQINSISNADLARIDQFLPLTIDTVDVARDLEIIAKNNQLTIESITTEMIEADSSVRQIQVNTSEEAYQAGETNRNLQSQLQTANVSISVFGEYEALLAFLAATESNVYPLQAVSMSVGTKGGGDNVASSPTSNELLSYDIEFVVRGLTSSM